MYTLKSMRLVDRNMEGFKVFIFFVFVCAVNASETEEKGKL